MQTFIQADLSGAILSNSNLTGTNISQAELNDVATTKGLVGNNLVKPQTTRLLVPPQGLFK